MRSDVDVRILGPLEVRDGERTLELGGRRPRALLAALALRAGEVVSADRLVDDLWGEAPPRSAQHLLHVYVSTLRKALEPAAGRTVLVTRAPGYVFELAADELDARRFERLLDAGRGSLAAGDSERAAATLREALSLWRGPALADFTYERFAQPEIVRLEELRLVAREERIEADLALGRHVELVGELEALVAENPLRERLRGQLMLALYRCGRQAEALEAYREARRTLVDELGIEPGPHLKRLEREILAHDASLELRGVGRRAPPSRRGRRRAALAVVAAAAATAAAGIALTSGSAEPLVPMPNTLVGIDPDDNRVVAVVPLGGHATDVVAGAGSLWVGNREDRTIERIDPRTGRVLRSIGIGLDPADLDFAAGALWVATGNDGRILRIDPSTNGTVADVDAGGLVVAVAGGRGGVWAALPPTTVVRYDVDGRIVARAVAPLIPGALASDRQFVWVSADAGRVTRLPSRGRPAVSVLGRTNTGAYDLERRGTTLWVPLEGGRLWRLRGEAGRPAGSVALGYGLSGVAAAAGSIWVSSSRGWLHRVDPHSLRRTASIRLPGAAWGAAALDGVVWTVLVKRVD